MKTLTLAKIFAALFVCFLIGSLSWDAHIEKDKIARMQARTARCDKAYADNERIKQVMSACAHDSVVRHYDNISMLLFATLVATGLGAVLSFSVVARERQGK
jgi:hypothetical protein